MTIVNICYAHIKSFKKNNRTDKIKIYYLPYSQICLSTIPIKNLSLSKVVLLYSFPYRNFLFF